MIDSTNPRILANNIRALAKKIASIVPGTIVEGNPSGSGFNTLLTKIKIGSIKYKLPDQVVANPEGEATDNLNSIGIGNLIYSIPGLNLSTTPTKIGKYMNEDFYAVIIDCGDVNAGAGGKTVTHNISDISEIIFYYGIGYNSTESAFNLLPRVDNDITYQRGMRTSATNIVIGGATNAPALTDVKAIIIYTKTTTP